MMHRGSAEGRISLMGWGARSGRGGESGDRPVAPTRWIQISPANLRTLRTAILERFAALNFQRARIAGTWGFTPASLSP